MSVQGNIGDLDLESWFRRKECAIHIIFKVGFSSEFTIKICLFQENVQLFKPQQSNDNAAQTHGKKKYSDNSPCTFLPSKCSFGKQ